MLRSNAALARRGEPLPALGAALLVLLVAAAVGCERLPWEARPAGHDRSRAAAPSPIAALATPTKAPRDVAPPAASTGLLAEASHRREVERAIDERLDAWRLAWEGKDLASLTAFYSETRPLPDFADWERRKRRAFADSDTIAVIVSGTTYEIDGDEVAATFLQRYTLGAYSDVGIKTMVWIPEGGTYRIAAESFVASAESSD